MSGLPNLTRRLPRLFYLAAAIIFIWRIGNSYMELTTAARSMGAGLDDAMGSLMVLQKSKILYYSVEGALNFIAYGAIIQVLIAIHDRLGDR